MSVGIVASAHVVTAAAATKWVNHVAIAAPRNGTTSHTVNPASGTVVAGTNFTPTAGRFLLLVIEGPVTSTAPSWTLEASAVGNTGLYCYTRTAAGSDTVVSSHGSSSNYPVVFHWFEFNNGTTWTSDVSSTSIASAAGANPNLTGLTGTNLVMGAKARVDASDGTAYSGVWGSPNVEVLDYNADGGTPNGLTDGYWVGICYQESYATSSYQPTCTVTGQLLADSNCEAITWALKPV